MTFEYAHKPREMRGLISTGVLLILVMIAACDPGSNPERPSTPSGGTMLAPEQSRVESTAAGDSLGPAVVGQVVYVPVYSHIYFRDGGRDVALAATISVRNTDPEHPISVATVEYYDSAGQFVRRYGEGVVVLPPLASQAYVVGEQDRTGGVGANFIVEWEASVQVSAPIIEAVMISTASTQGISFVSRGQVVRSLGEADRTTTE